jgi:hypothetical protein
MAAKQIEEEKELTVREWIEKTGHNLSFLRKARQKGLAVQKYGKSVRILWSEWIKWRAQFKQVGQ